MKSNKKIALVLLASLIAVSFVSTAPMSSKGAAGDVFQSYTGHDLSETYWSILYDTAGSYVEEDYNQGEYYENLDEGSDDDYPNIDSKYYFAWNNLQNVHTAYIAMQNFTWDVANYNTSMYGCAPYQMYFQHFRLPDNPKYHAFVLNKFLGLMAYRDMPGGLKDLPDENDSLYLGWTRFSEWHKFIVNSTFDFYNVPKYYRIDNKQGKATPIEMTYDTETETYEFGMCYEDIFVLWQDIDVEEGLDQSVQETQIVNNCSAFAMISSINFTFRIKSAQSTTNPGYNEITTTTEYDIGELDDLWIISDNESTASYFGGESFNNVAGIDIGHYNSTNDGIAARLNGNETVPGFGLSVINTANVEVLHVPNWLSAVEPIDVQFTDSNNNQLGNSFMNISQSELTFNDTLAYSIDFASKPNYVWDGTETLEAPTRVLKNSLMKTNTSNLVNLETRLTLATLIGYLTSNLWASLQSFFNDDIFGEQYFSLTCFPKWQGKSISQDPTFTVFVKPEGPDGIPGFELTVIGLVGLCSVSLIAYKVWKKKKLK